MAIVITPKKQCRGPCGRLLSLDSFHREKNKKHGRHSICKECRKDAGMVERRSRGVPVRPILHLIVNEDGTAVCPHCNERKLLKQFKSQPKAKHGRSSICHKCAYGRFQKPRVKRGQEWVDNFKLERGCSDPNCPVLDGYREKAIGLDFDHRPGEVKCFDISQGINSHSWKAVLEEIAKCDVLCAICHRIRTAERREEVMPVTTWETTLTTDV